VLGATVRTLLVALGGLIAVLGLLTMATVDAFGGLWFFGFGAILVVAGLLERRRYRSADAELGSDAAGPGGGEPAEDRLEPRFRPTSEVFVDPTTGHKMRVLVDPATGERRYRAEA
jgi:hypothetical protein